jgi:hypothetical protein
MFVRIFSAIVLALSLPVAASAQEASNAIALADFGGRLRAVRLSVNGQEGLFTIDTGGGISLVSPAFARRIGCVPWGAHTGFRLTGERLDMPRCERVAFRLPGGETLRPVSAGVADLKPLLWEGAPDVDGSIALDAFEGRAFTLDLGNGTLALETPQSLAARTSAAVEIPMRLVRQDAGHALGVVVPVETAKGDLWMTLDSGGGPPVLLRDKVAAEAGADPAAKGLQAFTLTLAGNARIALPTRAIVRDMIMDGVIGMPVLVRWRLTFDLATNRLWLASSRP